MAKELLTVSGTLNVRHTRTAGSGALALPTLAPLSRVAVRVKAKHLGVWRDLGETITDFAGRFSISSTERATDWRFRIDVRLKSDDLVVRSHAVADWDTVLEQPAVRGDDLQNVSLVFGDQRSSSRDATERLDDPQDHERAEVWAIARRLLKGLQDLGSAFPAGLIRPYTLEIVTPSLTTYASPVTRNVHLVRGETVLNILHESMHIWAYDHTRALVGGQAGLIPSVTGGGTHEPEERESTAFHEGFAQFAARHWLNLLYGAAYPRPRNRAAIAATGVRDFAGLLRNDDAWESALLTLTMPELHRFEFGSASGIAGGIVEVANTGGGCSSPATSFRQMLAIFSEAPSRGFEHRLGRREMRDMALFLQRVCGILRGDMNGRADEFLRLLDPAETIEPRALFCL